MVFKAIMGIGHDDSPLAENLSYRFFDYALQIKEKETTALLTRAPGQKPVAWKENFDHPPFVGDFLNQEMFRLSEAQMIPVALQVPLPTEEVANAWNKGIRR
jgi:hypothetical protein